MSTQPAAKASVSLAPRALYQEVAERLRQQIYGRELEPGAWIDELKLCKEMGISRTPMREALKVLAVEGLVTMKVRRGAYVTELSEQDVRDAYHLLALLESDAAGQVALKASDAQLEELRALHTELEARLHDRDRFFAANEAFHLKLLELDGNRLRQQLVSDLRRVIKLNRHHSLFKSGRLRDSLQEHEQLVQALSCRNGAEAERQMRLHFQNGLAAAQTGP